MVITVEQIQSRMQADRATLPKKFEDRKMQESLLADFDRLQKQLNGFRDQLDKIMKDPRLSPKGQADKIAESATQWAGEMKWFITKADNATAAVTRLRAIAYRLPALTSKRSDVVQFFREQELRLEFREQTEGERFNALLEALKTDPADTEAVANGKAETVSSLLDAPGGPLISAELLDRAQRQYAEQTKPDVLHTLEETEVLLDQLQGLSDHIMLWLKGLGADPVAVAA